MTAPHALDVWVPLDSEALAEHVRRALAVEASAAPSGTRVTVSRKGAELRLRLEAADTRGLRAASNSFLRIAEAAIAVARAAAGTPPKP